MNKTLADVKNGEIFKIIDCSDMPTRCLIMRFGLSRGEILKCVAKAGPIVIGKNKQVIAVGKNLANKIFVQAA